MTRREPSERKAPASREPLRISLSVTVRTGPDPQDHHVLMRDRELRIVGSVFEYRDRILRYFVGALWRVAAASPAVYREVAPGLTAMLQNLRGRA